MSSLGFKSIMLDTSFCIRLMDNQETLHQNALDYFRYFLSEKIIIHLSTIAVAEYAVGDDPVNLPVDKLQIESFDFRDAIVAGKFHGHLRGIKTNVEGYNRRIIANDIKMLAQIESRKIEAIITKDVASYSKFVKPLIDNNLLSLLFIDLNTPLNVALGKLF
jgi:predicted nucleic acid-binding protein